jgi:hypothetical protein
LQKSEVYKGDSFLDTAKSSLSAEADVEQIQMNLLAFEKVHGTKDGGPIAIDIPSCFRWLTALSSSVIQTSRPHPACDDEENTQRLFEDMVL